MGKLTQEFLDREAYSLVYSTFDHFKKQRIMARIEDEWNDYERAYFNRTGDYYNGMSKVRVPALHQSVERIVPKMDKVLFPPDGEYFEVRPRNMKDEIAVQQATLFTTMIKDQLDQVKVRSKLIGVYRSLCIYGTVFLKTHWRYESKKRFKRIPDGKRKKRQEVWETIFDNPEFYSPEIRDIYADLKDENLEGAVIERNIRDYSELYKKRIRKEDGEEVGAFRNVEKLKDTKFVREVDSDKQKSDTQKGMDHHEFAPSTHKIETLEYWGPVPTYLITGDEEDLESGEITDDGLIIIALGSGADGVCLVRDDNPFDHQEKPYLVGRYIKVTGKLYGLGVMSVNISMQEELNTLRNQLTDMRTSMLKKKWKVDIGAEIDDRELRDVANNIIHCTDINGLQEVQQQDFAATAMAQHAAIEQNLEDSTGASKLLGGTPTGGSLDRTAAGVATVVQGGLERFELVVTQFEEEIMKPLVRHFWMLDQQFLPEGREIEIVGEGLVNVDPSAIPIPQFRFVGIKELGEKEYKLNQLNILLQNLAPYIPLGLDPLPILFRMLKLLGMGELISEVDMRPEGQMEETPEGEIMLLRMGKQVRINLNDNHDAYIAAYQELLADPQLPDNVRKNTEEALGQRELAKGAVTAFREMTTKEKSSVAA